MSEISLEEKKKKAIAFLAKYRKSVEAKGSGVVADFADKLPENYQSHQRLPLGIPSLDTFFGGGLPMGGLITVGGAESSGKTSFALNVAAAAQRKGKLVLYADAEGTFDSAWAKTMGVNTENLIVLAPAMPPEEDFTPTTLEDYLNGIIQAVNGGIVDLVIKDSLDAMMARGRLKSKKGVKRDLDNADIALKARVLSDYYPRVLGSCRENAITLLQIGQLRATGIGTAFVSNRISGGNARKFYDLMTLTLRRGKKDDTLEGYGYTFIMTATKSKVGGVREGDQMETVFFHDLGFDPNYELVVQGLDKGLIIKKGTAACTYTDHEGNDYSIRGGKPMKVTTFFVENNLIDDLRMQLTGEVTPNLEESLDTETDNEKKIKLLLLNVNSAPGDVEIEIELEEDCGTITSNLPGAPAELMPNAFDTVETMVLNHMTSGVDITSKPYLEGLGITLEFLFDEYNHQ